MRPLGMNGRTATIKDIMINRKIPAAHRAHYPLITVNREVAWLPGHMTSHSFRVTAATQTILHLHCYQMQ